MEAQQYDIVTIAAVADDVPMLKIALEGGCKATNITSPYHGTALIAAAHLGHDEVVRTLIAAKAPLDHVNNLGWTAVIESIVLGDGGKRHIATLKALIDAKANINLADSAGATPLTLAKRRGYTEMVAMLTAAGGRLAARSPGMVETCWRHDPAVQSAQRKRVPESNEYRRNGYPTCGDKRP